MDLDQVFQHVGEFGKYQKLLLLLVCMPACVPCGFWIFNQVFMSLVPEHWCKVPAEFFPSNWTEQQRKLVSIPFQDGKFSRCSFYDVNFTEVGDSFFNTSEQPLSECKYGWEFDTTQVSSSVVIDFGLVCKHEIMPTVSLSALNTASIVGVFFFGYLCDKIGRRKTYFICLTVGIVGGIATALAPEIISFTISRTIVGLTVPAIIQITLLMCLEFVGPTKRTFVSFLLNMYYASGLLMLSGITYLLRNWRHLAYATSVPFVGLFVFMWFLPETPRWLLIQQRWTEVGEFLEKTAAVNQTKLPTGYLSKLQGNQKGSSEESPVHRAGFCDLFRTPNIRLKTIVVTFCWVVCQTVFIGLGYYGPAMGSDGYLSFFLSCLVEMPGYLLSYIGMEKFGRRPSLCFFMIVSGLAALSTALTPPDMAVATLVLFLLSKLSIAGGIMVIFQYGGELYPTEIRGVGMGFSAAMGGVGLATVPFLNYLGTDWLTLPIVVMGILNILGGILALRLPETLNQPLPQTVADGESFGKDMTFSEGLFMSKCCQRDDSEDGADAAYKERSGIEAPVRVFVSDET